MSWYGLGWVVIQLVRRGPDVPQNASQPFDSSCIGGFVLATPGRQSGLSMELSCLPLCDAYYIKMIAPHPVLVGWPTSLVEPSAAVLFRLQPTVPPRGSAMWPRGLTPIPEALNPIPQRLWPGVVGGRAPHSSMLPNTDRWVCTSLSDLSLMGAGVDEFLDAF